MKIKVWIISVCLSLSFCSVVPATGWSDDNQEKRWIAIGMTAIQERMKDPGSVKFRNVKFHRGKLNIPVCYGEVNAKNSFGGYRGFQRFIAAGDQFAYVESDIADFDNLWRKLVIE